MSDTWAKFRVVVHGSLLPLDYDTIKTLRAAKTAANAYLATPGKSKDAVRVYEYISLSTISKEHVKNGRKGSWEMKRWL